MHYSPLKRADRQADIVTRVRHFGVALILNAGIFGSVLAQETEPHLLLTQMASAIQSLDYQGSFIYQHAGRIDTLRVVHAGGSRERERLISLNGPRTEVIRNGLEVTFIQPDGSAIIYPSNSGRGLLPLVPGTSGRPLDESYQVHVAGSDRVAGYVADVIEVEPRDSWRYGYRLWLDRNTRLLLRSVVMDHEKQPLEQFMFVALEIGPLPGGTELVPGKTELLTTRSAHTDDWMLQKTPNWKVSNPPPGFAFCSVRRSPQEEAGSEHLVYSDGLANVSIYLEPNHGEDAPAASLGGSGPLNILTIVKGDVRITAIGDVPGTTLAAFANSLERIAAPIPANE